MHDDHCADLRANLTASIDRLLVLAALSAAAAVLIAVETLT